MKNIFEKKNTSQYKIYNKKAFGYYTGTKEIKIMETNETKLKKDEDKNYIW